MAQRSEMGVRRPGWLTFAAVVSWVAGAFYILIAFTEFANSYWIYSDLPDHVYSLGGSHLLWWGIFDILLGGVAIIAGVSLLQGAFFGLAVALTGAACGALRWLFYIPTAPWLAMTVILIDVLVIYGLCVSIDYVVDASDMRPA